MTSRRADIASGSLAVLFGASLAYMSLDLGWVQAGQSRPGLLAGVSGTIMVAAGLQIVARAVLRPSTDDRDGKRRKAPSQPGDSDTAETTEAQSGPQQGVHHRTGPVVVVLVLVFVAVYLTKYVGFVIAFGVLTFFLLVAMERVRLWAAALYAIVISVATWLLFVAALRVPLPAGFWD